MMGEIEKCWSLFGVHHLLIPLCRLKDKVSISKKVRLHQALETEALLVNLPPQITDSLSFTLKLFKRWC